MPRPCPFVSCRHHLFLEVGPTGGITFPFGEDVAALSGMRETCSLDAAANGGRSYDAVGDLFNLVRERARQLEVDALESLSLVLHGDAAERGDLHLPSVAYSQAPVDDALSVLGLEGEATWLRRICQNVAKTEIETD